MFDIKDIHSVTDFQRNTKRHVARLKRSKSPMVLTVNGTAEVIVQDATAYQQLVQRLAELEHQRTFVAAVREGIEDARHGRVYPAREVLKYRGDRLEV